MLSVSEIEHESGVSVVSMMSIHGPIIDARCSSMFMVARRRRSSGISKRQARPLWLYPPNPAGHASEKYACVGLRNVIRLKSIPLCDFWR